MQAVDSLLGFNNVNLQNMSGMELYPFLVFPHYSEFSAFAPPLPGMLDNFELSSSYPLYRIDDDQGIVYDDGKAWLLI